MTNPTPHGQVPEALRLAHIFDNPLPPEWPDIVAAAAELRRQHTRIAELEAQIEALSGVQALSAAPAIKPLVWSDERGPTDKIRYITAETALGQFSVEWKGWKEEDGPCVYLAGDYIGVASDLGGAKMLAEQHIREFVANLLAAPATPTAEQQAAPKAAPGEPDPADIIAGALQISRGHAIEMMREACLGAAPQQEAQEPAAWRLTNTAYRKPKYEYFEHKSHAEVRQEQFNQSVDDGGLHNLTPLYTAPQPAPAPLSEMPYEKRKAIQEGEQISASDAWFHARINMLDTLDRRNVFRAGFDRGWNAALDAQGGKDA